MSQICLIRIEWNGLNGLILSILDLEIGRFESMLFGFHFGWKSYCTLYLFFIPIEIKKPWYDK